MHVFLTGERGVGKSTALRRALELLDVVPGGFHTYFDAPRRRLYLAAPAQGNLCDDAHTVGGMVDGRARADRAAFDRVGVEAIHGSAPGAAILLFDECGKLEEGAADFQAAVLAALDGPIPILGVIKPDRAGSWLEKIAKHPRVELILVTEENRDGLPQLLATRMRDVQCAR